MCPAIYVYYVSCVDSVELIPFIMSQRTLQSKIEGCGLHAKLNSLCSGHQIEFSART